MKKKFPAHIKTSEDSTLLHNLCFIYTSENYWLRHIPLLVNCVETTKLSQILSDHVSIIMDRLNLLDDIFSHYKTRPSSFKGLKSPMEANLRKLHIKGDKKNQQLINDLIEVSKSRYPLYELLVMTTKNQEQSRICAKLLQILNQEEKFYQDLTIIRREIDTSKIV